MRTSFHHQPEAQHPNFQPSTSWQADYPIFRRHEADKHELASICPLSASRRHCTRDKGLAVGATHE